MSKRKNSQYIERAYQNMIDEQARLSIRPNSKIETSVFIKPYNIHQKQFIKSIKQNQFTVALGAAGTGKTLLSLFTAVQLINNMDSPIEGIVYIRSNIKDQDELEIGCIPGGLQEKVSHLSYPILDNMTQFCKRSVVEDLLYSGVLEITPLSLLRGRSFDRKIIILDEAQNCTPRSMKTILTRFTDNSKMIVIGDPCQCDIKSITNGLIDLKWRLTRSVNFDIQPPSNIGIIQFDREDIVRSKLTKFFLDIYDL